MFNRLQQRSNPPSSVTSHVSAATIPTTSPARRRPVLTAEVAAILLSLEPLTDGRLMVGVIGENY